MKQIQFRGTKNVRRHRKIWSRHGDLLPDIGTFLINTILHNCQLEQQQSVGHSRVFRLHWCSSFRWWSECTDTLTWKRVYCSFLTHIVLRVLYLVFNKYGYLYLIRSRNKFDTRIQSQGYILENQGKWFDSRQKQENFPFLKSEPIVFKAHRASYPIGTGCFFTARRSVCWWSWLLNLFSAGNKHDSATSSGALMAFTVTRLHLTVHEAYSKRKNYAVTINFTDFTSNRP
jgi:hypothetical protein